MMTFTSTWVVQWDFNDGEKKARLFHDEAEAMAFWERMYTDGGRPVLWDKFTLVEGW